MSARVLEAWGHRDYAARHTGGRWDPPHLIRWPEGARTGPALCGKTLAPLRLELPGTAAGLGVKVCWICRNKAAPPPTLGELVELGPHRSVRASAKRRAL